MSKIEKTQQVTAEGLAQQIQKQMQAGLPIDKATEAALGNWQHGKKLRNHAGGFGIGARAIRMATAKQDKQ